MVPVGHSEKLRVNFYLMTIFKNMSMSIVFMCFVFFFLRLYLLLIHVLYNYLFSGLLMQ